MRRSARRRVLWVGDRVLYDAVTEHALREQLADRGWLIHTPETVRRANHRSLEHVALVHCWDLASIDAWLPILRTAREAGLGAALTPAYDRAYFEQLRQRTHGRDGGYPSPDTRIAERYARMQQRFALSQADQLFATAHRELDALQDDFSALSGISSTIIPACIAQEWLQVGVQRWQLAATGPYVVCIGPISPVHGQAEIIRAACEAGLVPVIVGTASPEDAEYERECRALATETVWFASLSIPECTDTMRRAHAVVHPARGVTVPFLTAYLGVPVVLPITHYVREQINGDVILYQRSDGESLDRALHAVANRGAREPQGGCASHPSPAESVEAAVSALATAYDAIAAVERRKDGRRETDGYVRFLERELMREYKINQTPDTVVATLEAQVAWYRRIADEKLLGSVARQDALLREGHAGTDSVPSAQTQGEGSSDTSESDEEREAVQSEEADAPLLEELAWRRQAMESMAEELDRYRSSFEARVRSRLPRIRGRRA
jgi:hypothetical protein